MKTKDTIIFIYNDAHQIDIYTDVAKYFGFKTEHFFYPEDFQKWVKDTKEDFKNVSLIVLGHLFPGDGREGIKSGYFRGLDFYKEEYDTFKEIKVIIPCTMLVDDDAYENKLKEHNVVLKRNDLFIDLLNLMFTLRNFLERETKNS